MDQLSRSSILELSFDTYHYLVSQISDMDNAAYQDVNGVTWNNADNICTGKLGTLFFFLELVKETGDNEVWTTITRELEWFDQYISQKETYNYTLFNGRTGLAWFYLDLYRYTGDISFLEKTRHLVKAYLDSDSYRYGIISGHGLYNGTAGLALIFLHIYAETGETWLIPYIEAYILKLTHDCYITDKGICWGSLDRSKNSIGLGTGATGTGLFFAQLSMLTGDHTFLELAQLAIKEEDRYLTGVIPANGRGAMTMPASLSHGLSGMLLGRLYSDNGVIPGNYRKYWNHLQDMVCRSLHAPENNMNDGIFHGAAGVGMAFREAYRSTGDNTFMETATAIAAKLVKRIRSGEKIHHSMDGLSGAAYFLLHILNVEKDAGIVLPINTGKNVPALTTDSSCFYEMLLKKDFSNALSLFKQELPDELNTLRQQSIHPGYFIDHLKIILNRRPSDLNTLFEKELQVWNTKIGLIAGSMHQEDDLERLLDMENVLGKNNDWFMESRFAVSQKARIRSYEAPLAADEMFDVREFVIFFEQYGLHSFSYKINDAGALEATKLGRSKLVLDKLDKPRPGREVVEQIKGFLFRQNVEVVAVMKTFYATSNLQALSKILSDSVLDMIKQLYIDEVIVIVP
jgi:Lanthionine synthetase C-like protein